MRSDYLCQYSFHSRDPECASGALTAIRFCSPIWCVLFDPLLSPRGPSVDKARRAPRGGAEEGMLATTAPAIASIATKGPLWGCGSAVIFDKIPDAVARRQRTLCPPPRGPLEKPMFAATLLTLFPEMFPGPLGLSLAGDALQRGLWFCEARDIRDHGLGRHRAVDDTPAGGGPGMVMRADVLAAALDAAAPADDARPRLIMSARGKPFTQADARRWAAGPGLVIVCPRFEGFDERVIEARGAQRGLDRRLRSFRRRDCRACDPRRLRAAHPRSDGQGRIGRLGEF